MRNNPGYCFFPKCPFMLRIKSTGESNVVCITPSLNSACLAFSEISRNLLICMIYVYNLRRPTDIGHERISYHRNACFLQQIFQG